MASYFMMDGVSCNDLSNICNCKSDIMNETLLSSLNPQANIKWDHDSSRKLKKGKVSIDFRREGGEEEVDGEAIAHLKEIIYTAAALRPVALGAEEAVEKPKRKNLKISNDPQTAAARRRRERISNRLRVLQRLVPGGRKMDTASMLDEAANYLKFLKAQINDLEMVGHDEEGNLGVNCGYDMLPFPISFNYGSSVKQPCIFPLPKP